jgi:protein-disulfide isomerase
MGGRFTRIILGLQENSSFREERNHLYGKPSKVLLLTIFLSFLGGAPGDVTRAQQSPAGPVLSEATREKVVRYIRERFGWPDTVKMNLGAPRSSFAAGFYEVTVTTDDGKNKHDQVAWVSKDSHYLLLGNLFAVDGPSNPEVIHRLRETFKIPDNIEMTLGGFHASPAPYFQEAALAIDNGKGKQEWTVLLAKDGQHAILGKLYTLDVDLRQQALHTISLRNGPSQGPASAPVTIVEYADLQCPTCATLHQFFETQLLPRYGNKVRVIFKEFPLVGIHDWSPSAAVACQCAYEMNPSAYVPLRTAIFRSQQAINITNVRDLLLDYGEQAGVDRVKLAACIDAKSSWPHVEADLAEGKRVNVASTPTAFINGRMLIGMPSAEAYYQAVDEALRGAK